MNPTAEYVQLCREVNLPREWQPGDAYALTVRAFDHYEDGIGFVTGGKPAEAFAGLCWLPREGDLLDLLKAEQGVTSISFGKTGFGDWWTEVTAGDRVHNLAVVDSSAS